MFRKNYAAKSGSAANGGVRALCEITYWAKMKLVYPRGATPLDPNEVAGLIPDYISVQGELNELEAKNIQSALKWLRKKRGNDTLNVSFVMELHKKMFGEVWKWAGVKRISEKNIGVAPEQIMPQLGQLLENTNYWIKNQVYSMDETAARFHHKLTQIHIFPNGNGRHARLMTDILLQQNGTNAFSWGSKENPEPIDVEGAIRDKYISALQAADAGDFEMLKSFVRIP